MKKILRFFRKIITGINPVLANKIMYKVKMRKKLNIKEPKTFNEKICWLKLFVYPKDEIIIECSDKFKVRKYLTKKGMEKYLTNLYGNWDKIEKIEWDKLPNSFVLKCNHGCGYNIICTEKTNFDIVKIKNKLKKWLKEDFGKVSCEPHYSKIERRVICEEYLEDDILDYKFFCFKGEPKFFYVAQNIKGDFHNMQADFCDLNGNLLDFSRTDHRHFEKFPTMPDNLNEMIDVSKKLSEDFNFVRVDLFNVKGKIYFSELTFSPCSGFMPLSPSETDRKLGDLINLEEYKNYII